MKDVKEMVSRRAFAGWLVSTGVLLGNACEQTRAADGLDELIDLVDNSTTDRTPRSDTERLASNSPKRYAVFCSQTHMIDYLTSLPEKDRLYRFMYSSLEWSLSTAVKYGQFDQIYFLAGRTLTRENVIELFSELAKETQPGDEVFIYWNGHGGSGLPSTDSTESDGFDEFLVVYDTDPSQLRETSITDDDFGELIAKFADRRVMLMVESCHSGGLVQRESAPSRTTETHREQVENGTSSRSILGTYQLDQRAFELKTEKEVGQLHAFLQQESRASNVSSESSSSTFQDAFSSLSSSRVPSTNTVTRSKGLNGQRFLSKMMARAKDISRAQPMLSAIFACAEDESAYAGFYVDEEKDIYLNPLAFSYVYIVENTPEELVQQSGEVSFTEFCTYAEQNVQKLIQELKKQYPDEKIFQTPVTMNQADKIFLRPPKREA